MCYLYQIHGYFQIKTLFLFLFNSDMSENAFRENEKMLLEASKKKMYQLVSFVECPVESLGFHQRHERLSVKYRRERDMGSANFGLFPRFRDFGNRSLSRKEIGVQDQHFQPASRECVVLHYWNALNCDYSRKIFPRDPGLESPYPFPREIPFQSQQNQMQITSFDKKSGIRLHL